MKRNLLLANYPQGTKSFERWSKEISNVAKLINYKNYDWKQAAVDACGCCGSDKCEQGQKCPAMGQKCSNCQKMNHYAKACRSRPHKKDSLLAAYQVQMKVTLKNHQEG